MSAGKHVFAHFMVGNTYPYTVADWEEDIILAADNSLDGFVLNVGGEPWQKDRVSDAFDALERTGFAFKMFISFDMSSLPDDADRLVDYIATFAGHSGMFRRDGKVVVSTFGGEQCRFGRDTLERGWTLIKSKLEQITPIHFMPCFFLNPADYLRMRSVDGGFNWNGGWPLHLNADSSRKEIECPSLTSDNDHLRHLHGKTFMAAVSPWFFTHYGPDTWNKNWIYRGDDWLFVRRWEQLIANRDRIDIVQVISWNDYGESHYIGPIKGAQPNSQAWVDGFPHVAWLALNAYYAEAFTSGRYPTIRTDRIFAWARPHLKDAVAIDDSVDRPTHWQVADDRIWVVVFSCAPALLSLHGETYAVPAGVTKTWMPLRPGRGLRAVLRRERDGVLLAACEPSLQEFCCQTNPKVHNFNAFVAMS